MSTESRAGHVVVTPAYNEADYLPGLITSMVAQTKQPDQWLIVDDHSTDGTSEILEAACAAHPWIVHLRVEHEGERAVGSKVAKLFLWGLSQASVSWMFCSKIDADLTLPPDYFSRIFDEFERSAELGIASGGCYDRLGDELRLERVASDHTRGALKTYRRTCYEQMGGVRGVHGWDGIDNIMAQMLGWTTRNFPDIVVEHHRPTGSFEGRLKGRFTAGSFAQFMGYHPLFMAARSVSRMRDQPMFMGGVAMMAGYLWGHLRGVAVFEETCGSK